MNIWGPSPTEKGFVIAIQIARFDKLCNVTDTEKVNLLYKKLSYFFENYLFFDKDNTKESTISWTFYEGALLDDLAMGIAPGLDVAPPADLRVRVLDPLLALHDGPAPTMT